MTIYEVPLSLMNNKLDDLIVEKLGLARQNRWIWRTGGTMVEACKNPEHELTVGVVGKYVKHHDAYKSVYESLIHAGIANRARVHIRKIESEKIELEGPEKLLSGMDALLVPGGFDKRGINGKVEAIRFARENDLPFFGICLGLQCASIEFARNVLGLRDANSTEFNAKTPDPVVALLDEQRKVTYLGGTMRLGAASADSCPAAGLIGLTAPTRYRSGTGIAMSSTTITASDSGSTA